MRLALKRTVIGGLCLDSRKSSTKSSFEGIGKPLSENYLANDRRNAYLQIRVFYLQARSAQVPLIMSGKSMATSSSNYFNVAKALAVNSKDQNGLQQLAQQAKAVSDAMRRLITAIK